MKKWIFCQGKYHYSEDEFNHYESSNDFLPDCEEERDEDIKARLKIFLKYKEPKSTIFWERLKKIRKELQEINPEICYTGMGYGAEFEIFAVSVLHQLTDVQAYKTIVHGNLDGKVDAIVEEGSIAYAYQIKMDKLSDTNVTSEMKSNINKILRGETVDIVISHLKSFIDTHPSLLEKRFVYRTISDGNTSQNNITPSKILQIYFENALLPHEKSKLTLTLPIEKHDIYVDAEPIRDVSNYIYHAAGTQKPTSVFLFVNASKMIENLNNQGVTSIDDRLFYDNIRGKLGDNTAMRETIEDNPEMFVLYNNGLSVLGEWKQRELDFVVENPSFVNGQQTLFNLMKAKENGVDLSKITIPVFIKSANSTYEKQNIAFYNNSQRSVKEIDLLSLHDDIRQAQRYLLDKAYQNNFNENCYYLKIISNGERDSDIFAKSLFKKENIIPLSDFVRLYWILDRKERLGDWKNNISKMLRAEFIEKKYRILSKNCERVCDIIVVFNKFLAEQTPEMRKIYKNSDVVFMYLLNSFSSKRAKRIEMAKKVVDYINDKIYSERKEKFEKAKLIDLYKSNEILTHIDRAKNVLGFK